MKRCIRHITGCSFFLVFSLSLIASPAVEKKKDEQLFFPADHPRIQYTGRIDFTNTKLPRFWQPGVYISVKFSGTYCAIIINDEVLWGKNHNYLEIVVDGMEKRIQTRSAHDTIVVAEGLLPGPHTLLIVKNTEANIGYLEFEGLYCRKLLKPDAKPRRKIESIGNSITCGAGSDMSAVPCGKGVWHDQHNAYLGYAAITARSLNAQYHLSAVSGIGLMHSCCNMNIIMPPVFDKISMRNDTINWDFSKYQPDLVTVCLGQNDGIQDSAVFCSRYIAFFKQLRQYYPNAVIVLLSSPMADDKLREFMRRSIDAVIFSLQSAGEKKVFKYIFNLQYHNGCDWHPDITEHRIIAKELIRFIKKTMKW